MAQVLIIGYGNPLRGDDGIGWHAADRLAHALPYPEVSVQTSHQLTPEMAESVSRAGLVIFVDADCGRAAGEVACRPVEPKGTPGGPFSHQLTPETLLALARSLYGSCPKALLLSVGAASFEYGETLSPAVASALPALLEQVHTASRTGLQPCPANSSQGMRNEKTEDSGR
jgi:hydrogenase maturation protease